MRLMFSTLLSSHNINFMSLLWIFFSPIKLTFFNGLSNGDNVLIDTFSLSKPNPRRKSEGFGISNGGEIFLNAN